MEKLKGIEAAEETTPVDSPPPPYADHDPNSAEPISSPSKPGNGNTNFISRLFKNLTKGKTASDTDQTPASKPLEFYYPDPTKVLCRCGRHNNTTVIQAGLPPGKVRCTCGYTVESTGLSYYPSQHNTAPPPDIVMRTPVRTHSFRYLICGCGEAVELPASPKAHSSCENCDLTLAAPGSPLRLSDNLAETKESLRCSCGKLVDLSVEYELKHHKKHFTAYVYRLPPGSGRCSCGSIVSSPRSGVNVGSHGKECCTLVSTNRF